MPSGLSPGVRVTITSRELKFNFPHPSSPAESSHPTPATARKFPRTFDTNPLNYFRIPQSYEDQKKQFVGEKLYNPKSCPNFFILEMKKFQKKKMKAFSAGCKSVIAHFTRGMLRLLTPAVEGMQRGPPEGRLRALRTLNF